MLPFNEYIAGNTPSAGRLELARLTEQYEWFTTARRAKSLLTGEDDPGLELPAMFWPTVPPAEKKRAYVAAEPSSEPEAMPEAASAEDDLIGKFLEHGGYRIVPDGNPDVEEALTVDTFDDPDGELLTEELAEIYRSQSLAAEAIEIYRKLSLLNPEKSIYFADAIARIETENNK